MRAFCPRGQWASSSIRYQFNQGLLNEHNIAEPFHSLLPPHKGFCASEEARLCGAQIWSQVKESWCTFFYCYHSVPRLWHSPPAFLLSATWHFTEILRKEVCVVYSSNLSRCDVFVSWQFGAVVLHETTEPASVTRQSGEAAEAEAQRQPARFIQVNPNRAPFISFVCMSKSWFHFRC